MNPKVKELATQARIQMCSDARLQEFAELIVDEIVSLIQPNNERTSEANVLFLKDKIVNHFKE